MVNVLLTLNNIIQVGWQQFVSMCVCVCVWHGQEIAWRSTSHNVSIYHTHTSLTQDVPDLHTKFTMCPFVVMVWICLYVSVRACVCVVPLALSRAFSLNNNNNNRLQHWFERIGEQLSKWWRKRWTQTFVTSTNRPTDRLKRNALERIRSHTVAVPPMPPLPFVCCALSAGALALSLSSPVRPPVHERAPSRSQRVAATAQRWHTLTHTRQRLFHLLLVLVLLQLLPAIYDGHRMPLPPFKVDTTPPRMTTWGHTTLTATVAATKLTRRRQEEDEGE